MIFGSGLSHNICHSTRLGNSFAFKENAKKGMCFSLTYLFHPGMFLEIFFGQGITSEALIGAEIIWSCSL